MTNGNSWTQVSGSAWGGQMGGFRHAAARLADGASILITGGAANPGQSAGTRQAWLFDGIQLTSLAAMMSQPRFAHSATTLASGSVLLIGSGALDNADTASRTAELYSPGSRSFSSTGNLVEPRGWHSATLLPSGKVLVVGGQDPAAVNHGSLASRSTAEIYDPAAGSFRLAKGSLHTGQSRHTATLLDDGNTVLIVGIGGAELFDATTELFTVVGSPGIARTMHAAAKLIDGRVLIAGGYAYGGVGIQHEEIYDPATKHFVQVPPIQKTAYGLTLSNLPSGKVLAAGGSANGENVASLTIDDHFWLYDPVVNSFSTGGAMDRLAFHSATVLSNGLVFVVGGMGVGHQLPTSGQLYTPDLATLHLRFDGDGAGSVTSVPACISSSASADLQVPVGLRLYLRAQPSNAWSIIGAGFQRQVGVLQKFKPVKFRYSVFDGWGTGAAKDMSNPLYVVMSADKTLDVNFNIHIAEFTPKVPRPEIIK